MKEAEDNVLKSWVEESPHPYENDSLITKVSSKHVLLIQLIVWSQIVQSPKAESLIQHIRDFYVKCAI